MTEGLADRMARPTLAGRRHTPDPRLAAEQFAALLLGPVEMPGRLGTRKIPDAELRTVSRAAVHTFLRARLRSLSAPGPPAGSPPGRRKRGSG